jgi:hypothetical protein
VKIIAQPVIVPGALFQLHYFFDTFAGPTMRWLTQKSQLRHRTAHLEQCDLTACERLNAVLLPAISARSDFTSRSNRGFSNIAPWRKNDGTSPCCHLMSFSSLLHARLQATIVT